MRCTLTNYARTLYAVNVMPRPRSLTPAAVAAGALAVLDRDGPAGLTMRAVARELGMGTMSLYRYVTSREELEGLIVDLVLSGTDAEPPAGPHWTGRVTMLIERARAAVGAHPSVVPLLLTHRHTSANSIRWAERVLRALTDGGITGDDRVIAFRTLLAYLIGGLQTEHLGPLSGAGTAALAELPAGDHPMLADTARHASCIPPDEEFHRGLAVVLAGVTGLARTAADPEVPAPARSTTRPAAPPG